jgi:molybdopterin-binding protein
LPTAAPINLIRIDAAQLVGGQLVADISGQQLHLPSPATEPTRTFYVRFLPSDVTLSRAPVAGISIRNQLRGTVCELVRKEQDVFVQIDVGQPIWAEITAASASELGLAVGSQVTCLIKATALHIVR